MAPDRASMPADSELDDAIRIVRDTYPDHLRDRGVAILERAKVAIVERDEAAIVALTAEMTTIAAEVAAIDQRLKLAAAKPRRSTN